MPILATGQGGLESLDHLVIGIYLIAMLTMGIVIARKQRSTDDFFVGGRNLPAWAVGISLFASLLSTITYLGQPGEMFRTGILFLTRQLPVPVVLAVIWFLWIPFFMRLKLTSAYEYLERRFDYPTRAIAAVFCLLLLFGWMAVVVLTASRAMTQITHLDLQWFFGTNHTVVQTIAGVTSETFHTDADMHAIILSIGLFSVLYTTLGGIRAVVWTDVIQFVILMIGALFTMGAIASMTNSGVGDWLQYSNQYKHEKVEWLSFDPTNRSTILFISMNMLFWMICTHGANQVALQRYFAVKNVWAARKSYLVSAVASFGIGTILAGVGISLMYFINQPGFDLPAEAQFSSSVASEVRTAQDKIFPQFISIYLPAGLRGLVVSALFAAAMSTIDSGANSVSTILTVDFFRRLNPNGASVKQELKRARFITAGMGLVIVATTIALYHMTKQAEIISLMQKGFNCFLGPLGALFVLAMFSKRVTGKSAIPALLLGEAFGISASYSKEWFNYDLSTHLVVPLSWLVTIVLGHLFARLLGTQADEDQQQWMWSAIIRSKQLPQDEIIETAAAADD